MSLSLSFLDVGPCSVVPFIDSTIVELSRERNTKPRNPSASFSQPKGKLCEPLRGSCSHASGTTHSVDVPRGIEFVPIVFPGKLVGVGSHACELCKGIPVCDIGTEDLGFNPLHWLALGVVDRPPARVLECLEGAWSVKSRRDCF